MSIVSQKLKKSQELAFAAGQIQVIVATIAFGMGKLQQIVDNGKHQGAFCLPMIAFQATVEQA